MAGYPPITSPREPVPIKAQWAIIRFDMAHIEGLLEGVYTEEQVATKLHQAHQRLTELPDTYAHATRANFILFKRVDDADGPADQGTGHQTV